MAKNRMTTLEATMQQMSVLSNYRLVELWNALQGDQTSMLIIPLQDTLKLRGVNVRRGSICTRKFVDDETMMRLRGEVTTPKVKVVKEKIAPNLNVERVVHNSGKVLLNLHGKFHRTPEDIDKLEAKAFPQLKKNLRRPPAVRAQHYAATFRRLVWKHYKLQVINIRCGATFKALVKAGRTLVELRAGIKRGEQYIQATPLTWSQLDEV